MKAVLFILCLLVASQMVSAGKLKKGHAKRNGIWQMVEDFEVKQDNLNAFLKDNAAKVKFWEPIFHEHDVDGEPGLNRMEFNEAMNDVYHDFGVSEAPRYINDALFDSYNDNGDGVISFEEAVGATGQLINFISEAIERRRFLLIDGVHRPSHESFCLNIKDTVEESFKTPEVFTEFVDTVWERLHIKPEERCPREALAEAVKYYVQYWAFPKVPEDRVKAIFGPNQSYSYNEAVKVIRDLQAEFPKAC